MPAPILHPDKNKANNGRADSQLQARVNQTDKGQWARAAKKAGARSVTQWVIDTLNAEAERTKRKKKPKVKR